MKYPSASEVLSELETAKETGEVVWWKDLIHVPFDQLAEPTGKLQVLYKGKPFNVLVNKEKVVMGSVDGGLFDYSASVKLGYSSAYQLVELIGEIVQSLTLAYKALGEDSKDIDPIMQHVMNSCEMKEVVELTAAEFTSRAREYNDTK